MTHIPYSLQKEMAAYAEESQRQAAPKESLMQRDRIDWYVVRVTAGMLTICGLLFWSGMPS